MLQIKVYNTIAGYRSDKVSLNKVIRALRVPAPRRQKAGKIMASVFLRFYDYRVALVAVVSTNIFYVPGKGIFMVLKFVINCTGTFFVRANLLHQINVIQLRNPGVNLRGSKSMNVIDNYIYLSSQLYNVHQS